ncbi:hypothetical protein RIF29_29832 [Crotalaria pallida]|uniref:Uncharacterized protein n=1 Tax=Crotalaria pallida TaxID=3830 RepID=A0AAN9HWK0_CROPI
MAKKRTNVIPVIEDARHPAKYRMLVGMVDVIFSDVAQPDQVIPFGNKERLKEAFNIRVEELQVLDIKFLYGCSKPTIVVLYQGLEDISFFLSSVFRSALSKMKSWS